MSPIAEFALSFGVTLALLGVVVFTGRRALVKRHIVCVVLTLGALAWTIREAYQLGEVYDLPSAGIITPIHLTLAKITTLALLAPLATGVRTLLNRKGRALHKRAAYTVLVMVVLCALTGFAMIVLANQR